MQAHPGAQANLILLNGPPASGKSTISLRLTAARPLSLNLDVDAVRGMLGGWIDDPHDAGLAARRLAIAMIGAHLSAGFDVVVPQLVARDTFVRELGDAARTAGARFIEVALVVSRDDTLRDVAARNASPENQQHRDARELIERSGGIAAVGEMHYRLTEFLTTRHDVRTVAVVRGDIEATSRLVEEAIADSRRQD